MTFLNLTQAEWQQIGISAGIIAAAFILARPLLTFLLDKIFARITGLTKSTLDNKLLDAARPPLYWLVIMLTAEAALKRLDFLTADYDVQISNVTFLLYSLLVTVTLWRVITTIANWYSSEIAAKTETPIDDQMVPFVRRILLIVLAVIMGIVVLGYFEIEISGLVTTLGIGSLAVALAAQAALSDTISGFIIMIDRPFRIGDRIEILELDTWGDVEDIGLRSTRIRTRDNRMVIVPNSVISKSLVVNYAFPNTDYRIEIHVGVAYDTDIEAARKVLVDAVRQVEGVEAQKPVEALFLEFGDSALIFRVRWWLDSYVDTRRMFDKVNTSMYNALKQAGIVMPFPQREVRYTFDEAQFNRIEKTLAR
ncbi:MAG TPA: mechanosensitive ion channel family protein [Anaerolineales bacterium]|jgi:small-conductance mechanosensitive channel|nr:mechanosensitive ion channel family protein [Anaerolineales bacterium]